MLSKMPILGSRMVQRYDATVNWLLEQENPSVRYWTLQHLLGRTPTDPSVQEAHVQIQTSPPTVELLSHQQPDGSWRGPRGDIWEEKGTVFSLLLLAELGAEGSGNTEKALDHLHDRYQLSNGRLAYRRVDTGHRRESDSTWMWCVTAVTLRAALLLGHQNHPTTQQAIDFLEENYDERGGWPCSTYSRDPSKVRPVNCYMGSIKALSALSLIPPRRRSMKTRAIIEREVATCLENHVCFYRVDPKGQPALKRAWSKFAFPRYWRSDTLEAADVLTGLGVKDVRLKEALDIIKSKEMTGGRWNLDFSETKRAWISLEEEKEPSKWVTLRALRVINRSSIDA